MEGAILDVLVFTSIGLLGMGVLFKHGDRHILRSAGYVLFGLFWALRMGEVASSGDSINTFFVIMAFPFFLFLAYQEFLVYKGAKKNRGLEMLAGGVFFAGAVYFIMAKIPVLSGAVISTVAGNSAGLLSIFGGEYTVGPLIGADLWYSGDFSAGIDVAAPLIRADGSTAVYIVFECTGVQSIMIFLGPILFCTSALLWRKLFAAAIIAPTIYILNIFRNAGIVIMMDEMGIHPLFAHDVVGKIGSLAALILLAFMTFRMLPELLDDVDALVGLFSNATRRKPRSQPSKPSPPPPENPAG